MSTQVFDAGNNPAVAWHHYWTPMRFALLLKLAAIFDEPLVKKAWDARLLLNRAQANEMVTDCCSALIDRLSLVPDLVPYPILIKYIIKIGVNRLNRKNAYSRLPASTNGSANLDELIANQ
jgi:hypothetical protein